ncbi:unnamed protein product [Colias eurytheme]|nr:unnamed protein product [Colias eurytheme]
MEKLRFDFCVKTAPDGKSNVICITSIGTPDGKTFAIPADYQNASLHKLITNTSNYAKIRKTLNKRHQTRKIQTLTEEISKTYLDEEQNIQFNDFYLEEIKENINDQESFTRSSNETLEKLLEKLLEEKQKISETQNLGKIAKDFVIEKFTEKKPRQICATEKKVKRFHPEETCWFNVKNQKAIVKSVNNSELEIELNKENPKN